MAKHSCGHKADPMLTRAELARLPFCLGCDPVQKAKREKAAREARQRNEPMQRAYEKAGYGKYGPLADERPAWNPTPLQFINLVRALAIWGTVLDELEASSRRPDADSPSEEAIERAVRIPSERQGGEDSDG